MHKIEFEGEIHDIEPVNQCVFCVHNIGSLTCKMFDGEATGLIPEEYRYGPVEKKDCPHFFSEAMVK